MEQFFRLESCVVESHAFAVSTVAARRGTVRNVNCSCNESGCVSVVNDVDRVDECETRAINSNRIRFLNDQLAVRVILDWALGLEPRSRSQILVNSRCIDVVVIGPGGMCQRDVGA